jgi:hypothetical protein
MNKRLVSTNAPTSHSSVVERAIQLLQRHNGSSAAKHRHWLISVCAILVTLWVCLVLLFLEIMAGIQWIYRFISVD